MARLSLSWRCLAAATTTTTALWNNMCTRFNIFQHTIKFYVCRFRRRRRRHSSFSIRYPHLNNDETLTNILLCAKIKYINLINNIYFS